MDAAIGRIDTRATDVRNPAIIRGPDRWITAGNGLRIAAYICIRRTVGEDRGGRIDGPDGLGASREIAAGVGGLPGAGDDGIGGANARRGRVGESEVWRAAAVIAAGGNP